MISAETFHSLCRQNNQILTPVTLLQSKLRILILGINYWKRQTRNRVEICDGAYIPFTKLLKQITEGHRDRVRRASLLEMTYSLTQQLKNSQDDLSIEPTVEIESQSEIISCCFPWSPRKTYPEPLPLPIETAHISSWRISLEEQTKNISKNQEDTILNMESNINQRPSRSRSSVFEPEEPLDEDVEALLTKQLVSQRLSPFYSLILLIFLYRKARGRQPKFQPRSNPASDYVDDALDSP